MGAIYPGGDVAAEDDGGRGLEHAQKAVYQVSNRFTKINSRQAGQPHFPPADDVAPANGPVVTYRMSPEEIAAKYGPPVPRTETRRQKLSRENLIELLRTRTVGQVAERYCVPQKLVFELCDRFGLELDEKNRLASGGDEVAGRPAADLSKEELLEMLRQGMTAEEIADALGVGEKTVVRYKKKYGLTGLVKPGRPKKGENTVSICEYAENEANGCTESAGGVPEIMEEVPEPEAIALFDKGGDVRVELTTKMTIAQAVEYKQGKQKDLDCVKLVIEELSIRGERYLELTPGVESLLKGYRKECTETIDRINKAFETVEISI